MSMCFVVLGCFCELFWVPQVFFSCWWFSFVWICCSLFQGDYVVQIRRWVLPLSYPSSLSSFLNNSVRLIRFLVPWSSQNPSSSPFFLTFTFFLAPDFISHLFQAAISSSPLSFEVQNEFGSATPLRLSPPISLFPCTSSLPRAAPCLPSPLPTRNSSSPASSCWGRNPNCRSFCCSFGRPATHSPPHLWLLPLLRPLRPENVHYPFWWPFQSRGRRPRRCGPPHVTGPKFHTSVWIDFPSLSQASVLNSVVSNTSSSSCFELSSMLLCYVSLFVLH